MTVIQTGKSKLNLTGAPCNSLMIKEGFDITPHHQVDAINAVVALGVVVAIVKALSVLCKQNKSDAIALVVGEDLAAALYTPLKDMGIRLYRAETYIKVINGGVSKVTISAILQVTSDPSPLETTIHTVDSSGDVKMHAVREGEPITETKNTIDTPKLKGIVTYADMLRANGVKGLAAYFDDNVLLIDSTPMTTMVIDLLNLQRDRLTV